MEGYGALAVLGMEEAIEWDLVMEEVSRESPPDWTQAKDVSCSKKGGGEVEVVPASIIYGGLWSFSFPPLFVPAYYLGRKQDNPFTSNDLQT